MVTIYFKNGSFKRAFPSHLETNCCDIYDQHAGTRHSIPDKKWKLCFILLFYTSVLYLFYTFVFQIVSYQPTREHLMSVNSSTCAFAFVGVSDSLVIGVVHRCNI